MKRPKFGSIYRITCLCNAKVYIGLTRKYVSDRWYQHKKAAASGASSALYQAIRNHGADMFYIEHIACAVSDESLSELESLLIKQYGSYGSLGYNMSLGGERAECRTMTNEGKERLKQARRLPSAVSKNRAINVARMATKEGREHQAKMVIAARNAKDRLSESRKAYAQTEHGAKQIHMAAKKGAARKAEISSKKVVVGSEVFRSVSDAAEAYGIERGAVRWRIKSSNFEAWGWA